VSNGTSAVGESRHRISRQHGTPVDAIRKALLRDGEGRASSPLGRALDVVGW
jgi:hypothetical protein